MKEIKVAGMSCQHCVSTVKSGLEGLGLTDVDVSLDSGIVKFVDNPKVTAEMIKEVIEDAGFELA